MRCTKSTEPHAGATTCSTPIPSKDSAPQSPSSPPELATTIMALTSQALSEPTILSCASYSPKQRKAITLVTRRNGWYISRDDRNLVVAGRRVNEAMYANADCIMDSCALWREAGTGNKKWREQDTQYKIQQEAAPRGTLPKYNY